MRQTETQSQSLAPSRAVKAKVGSLQTAHTRTGHIKKKGAFIVGKSKVGGTDIVQP